MSGLVAEQHILIRQQIDECLAAISPSDNDIPA